MNRNRTRARKNAQHIGKIGVIGSDHTSNHWNKVYRKWRRRSSGLGSLGKRRRPLRQMRSVFITDHFGFDFGQRNAWTKTDYMREICKQHGWTFIDLPLVRWEPKEYNHILFLDELSEFNPFDAREPK